jgi:CheY-like chemotaxis protein
VVIGPLRILVLDDDSRRHEWFAGNILGHDSVWSAKEARRALQENPRYDLVFLDHDLAEDYSVVPAVWGEDGRTVARFIAAMPADRRPGMAHIHSSNWGGAMEMEAILADAGVRVARAEFPHGCKEAVCTIAAPTGPAAG